MKCPSLLIWGPVGLAGPYGEYSFHGLIDWGDKDTHILRLI